MYTDADMSMGVNEEADEEGKADDNLGSPRGYFFLDEPENPHLKRSQSGDMPNLPPAASKPYTSTIWPAVIILSNTLTKNINPRVLEAIFEDPESFLAIVPYGAGYRQRVDHPDMAKDIQDFLLTFTFENCAHLEIEPAAAKNTGWTNNFDSPIPLILSGFTNELRNFLLWHQMFPFVVGTSRYVFLVVKFTCNIQSWHITHLKGACTTDYPLKDRGSDGGNPVSF